MQSVQPSGLPFADGRQDQHRICVARKAKDLPARFMIGLKPLKRGWVLEAAG